MRAGIDRLSVTVQGVLDLDPFSGHLFDNAEDSCASLGRSTFSVVLTDDWGKEWRVDHTEQRVLVQA